MCCVVQLADVSVVPTRIIKELIFVIFRWDNSTSRLVTLLVIPVANLQNTT